MITHERFRLQTRRIVSDRLMTDLETVAQRAAIVHNDEVEQGSKEFEERGKCFRARGFFGEYGRSGQDMDPRTVLGRMLIRYTESTRRYIAGEFEPAEMGGAMPMETGVSPKSGFRSSKRTEPISSMAIRLVARLTATVVVPTPPLLPVMAMIFPLVPWSDFMDCRVFFACPETGDGG